MKSSKAIRDIERQIEAAKADLIAERRERIALDVSELIDNGKLCRDSRREWIDRLARDESGELARLLKTDVRAARRSIIRAKFPLKLSEVLAQWMPKENHTARIRIYKQHLRDAKTYDLDNDIFGVNPKPPPDDEIDALFLAKQERKFNEQQFDCATDSFLSWIRHYRRERATEGRRKGAESMLAKRKLKKVD